jgi:hypothetical protein
MRLCGAVNTEECELWVFCGCCLFLSVVVWQPFSTFRLLTIAYTSVLHVAS